MKRRDFITLIVGALAWPWARPLTLEGEIIAVVARSKGRALTRHEIFLCLEQARAIGDLDQAPRVVS